MAEPTIAAPPRARRRRLRTAPAEAGDLWPPKDAGEDNNQELRSPVGHLCDDRASGIQAGVACGQEMPGERQVDVGEQEQGEDPLQGATNTTLRTVYPRVS